MLLLGEAAAARPLLPKPLPDHSPSVLSHLAEVFTHGAAISTAREVATECMSSLGETHLGTPLSDIKVISHVIFLYSLFLISK